MPLSAELDVTENSGSTNSAYDRHSKTDTRATPPAMCIRTPSPPYSHKRKRPQINDSSAIAASVRRPIIIPRNPNDNTATHMTDED